MFSLLKTLYIQANEAFLLTVNSTTARKNLSLELLHVFLRNNVAIIWSEQYDKVTGHPKLDNDSDEVNL